MHGLEAAAHSEVVLADYFLKEAQALGVDVILDIGAYTGQFAEFARTSGYDGLIFSVEPQLACRAELTKHAKVDPRWIVLPNQAAGAAKGTTKLEIDTDRFSALFLDPPARPQQTKAAARATRPESVCVNRTDALLAPHFTARVGAIRLNAGGHELEILKGISDKFESLRLLFAEKSLDANWDVLDSYIQNELGFTKVSSEQSFSGVYQRLDRAAAAAPVHQGIELGAVITSIGGPYKRIGKDGFDHGGSWFNSCVSSWHRIAPVVASISEVRPPLDSVSWIETKQKPRIVEMLHKIYGLTQAHVIITNADVLLTDSLKDILPKLEPDILYYGNRINVNVDPLDQPNLQSLSYYDYGYDFFILPPKLVKLIRDENILPAHFRFGEPWWDYALPLLAMHHGFVIKHLRLNPPAALHFDHKNVSNKWWMEQGLDFLKWCEKLSREPQSPAAGLLQLLAPLSKAAKANPSPSLVEACKIFITWTA